MGKGNYKGLTDQHHQAIHYLIMDRFSQGDLSKKVGEAVGVSPITINQWRKREDFRAEYARQVALYRANFDDVKLADRKERVKALTQLYEEVTSTNIKLKILASIRAEVGDDKQIHEHHHIAHGVNTPPAAATYEEWLAQNSAMEEKMAVEGEFTEVDPPLLTEGNENGSENPQN